MNRNYQANRQGKGYHNNRPAASMPPVNGPNGSANTGNHSNYGNGTKEQKGRSDAGGDQMKGQTIQQTAVASPVCKLETSAPEAQNSAACDTPPADNGNRAIVGPDSTSSPPQSQPADRKDGSDGADCKETSLPYSSDLNGAPIVATAASSYANGGNGYNRSWNNSGNYRNRNGGGRSWGMAGGRNNGPNHMHNGRPAHMAPISAGYTGPPGRRSYVPAPPPPSYSMYPTGYPTGMPQSVAPFHMFSLAAGPMDNGPGSAALLPTPTGGYPPFPGTCGCNACQSYFLQYAASAAAAAAAVYPMPSAGMAYLPAMSLQQATDAFNFQSAGAPGAMDNGSPANGHSSSGMSPRPKGAPVPGLMFMSAAQKQKGNSDSKAGLAPITVATGMNKQPQQQTVRAQDQMFPIGAWSHQNMSLPAADQTDMQQGTGPQPAQSHGAPMRYTYFPNIANPQMLPGPVHEMAGTPLDHYMIGSQAGGQYVSSFTPRY